MSRFATYHMHEERAKELLAKHLAPKELDASGQRARLHMWTAVGVCGAVILAAYALVLPMTYDFVAVKQAVASAASQVQDFGAKTVPEAAEKPKMIWTKVQLDVQNAAEQQVKANVVEEMKKQLETQK